jgi:hypothetical protein
MVRACAKPVGSLDATGCPLTYSAGPRCAQITDSFPYAVHIASYVSQRRSNIAETVPYCSEIGVLMAASTKTAKPTSR